MNRTLETISDIGDSTVLVVMVLTAIIYLSLYKDYREVAALAASLIISSLAIGFLKIIFLICGNDFFNIHSPSGHSALSMAVFGTYALIVLNKFDGWRRFILPVLFFSLAVIIAVTRIVLKFHTPGEVLLGVFTGLCTVLMVWHFILRHSKYIFKKSIPRFNIYIFLVLTFIASVLAHGKTLPAEAFIRKAAKNISASVSFCNNGIK